MGLPCAWGYRREELEQNNVRVIAGIPEGSNVHFKAGGLWTKDADAASADARDASVATPPLIGLQVVPSE